MAKTRFWGRVVSKEVDARSFRRPCRGEGGSVNEGPAASRVWAESSEEDRGRRAPEPAWSPRELPSQR